MIELSERPTAAIEPYIRDSGIEDCVYGGQVPGSDQELMRMRTLLEGRRSRMAPDIYEHEARVLSREYWLLNDGERFRSEQIAIAPDPSDLAETDRALLGSTSLEESPMAWEALKSYHQRRRRLDESIRQAVAEEYVNQAYAQDDLAADAWASPAVHRALPEVLRSDRGSRPRRPAPYGAFPVLPTPNAPRHAKPEMPGTTRRFLSRAWQAGTALVRNYLQARAS